MVDGFGLVVIIKVMTRGTKERKGVDFGTGRNFRRSPEGSTNYVLFLKQKVKCVSGNLKTNGEVVIDHRRGTG